jgi:hypothetical protein
MTIAVDFLRQFDPTGWHNLVAIAPDTRAICGVTIPPGEWSKAEAFVEKWNGKRNLYWSVNEPKLDAPDAKLGEADIAAIRAVYADVDPKPGDLDAARQDIRNRAKLALGNAKPSLVIDSGGGLQFFWTVNKTPVDEAVKRTAKRQGRGIAHLMDGDGVCNIDRIMRLPGTVNLPDKAKLAKGRRVATATVLDQRDERYRLEDLAKFYRPLDAEEGEDKDGEIAQLQQAMQSWRPEFSCLDEAPDTLRARFAEAMAADEGLARLWTGECAPDDTSNSGWRFALAEALKSIGGFGPEDFASILYCWDRHDPEKITPRTIARDWIRADDGGRGLIGDLTGGVQETEQPASGKKFHFESFADVVAADITQTPALIDGLLDQGAMSVVYGDSNAGKTFVVMDMAFHVGAGLPYAGMDVAQGLVVYVAAEGGQGIKKRVKALHKAYPSVQPDFVLLASPVDLRNPKADTAPLCEAVRGLGRPVALMVIDTLSRAMAGGDENSSVDMGALVKHFDVIRKACAPAHLLIVHHTGKDKARGARGHSLLRAATDTEIEVAAPERGERGEKGSGGVSTITVTKQRDMDGEWTRAFSLREWVLGAKPNGKPITSCTVDLLTVGEARAVKSIPTATETDVLAALEVAQSEAGGGPVSTVAVALQYGGNTEAKAVSAIRQHLRSLETKCLVFRPKSGLWGVKNPILHFSHTTGSGVESVESVGKIDGGIFA